MHIEEYSFEDAQKGKRIEGDEYKIAEYALAEPRKSAFLSNPFIADNTKCMLYYAREGGEVIGRNMLFPSKFKAGDAIIDTIGGSALEVVEKYRDGDAGMSIIMYPLENKANVALIYSGFTPIAVSCYRALRFYMFDFPKLVFINNYRKVLRFYGINPLISAVLGTFANCLSFPFKGINKAINRIKFKNLKITPVKIVPSWVDDIVLNDGHKYMEVHNHEWLQWNLDNMFHSHDNNINRFYTVSIEGENIGFFMTKERFINSMKRGGAPIIMGSIVEWGIKKGTNLNESDMYMCALKTFSRSIGTVTIATQDINVVKKMKKLLFFPKGEAHIAFKDLTKQYKDAKDPALWRLRLGYADTILN